MYCGSCLRDNALANALHKLGEEVILIPTYTPLKVDEATLSGDRVFFNAIEVYLYQRFPALDGRRGLFRRFLGSGRLLKWISRFALGAGPRELGRLTISMLEGEAGNQRRLLTELVDFLEQHVQPDVVHLSNSLFSGFAREIKRRLQVPVVCGLQGEALFLEGLPQPFQSRAIALLKERGAEVDRFSASSAHEADHMAAWIGLDRSRIDVVYPGIDVEDFAAREPSRDPGRPLTIGFLARMSSEKGFHVLAEAFVRLVDSGEFPGLRLKAAGYLGGKGIEYVAQVRRALARRGVREQLEVLGTVSRREKLELLRQFDVFSVPTVFPEPKGIFLLEAMASGVPVVEPRHGSFPELLGATGGGILHDPSSVEALAGALAVLLRDAELRRNLGRKGREGVLERFTSKCMAERTLELYRKVVPHGVP